MTKKMMVCIDASPTFLYSKHPALTRGKIYEVEESPATGTVLVYEPDVSISYGKWVPVATPVYMDDKFGNCGLRCVDPTAIVGEFTPPTRFLRTRFSPI